MERILFSRSNKPRGFTLTELALVLSIVGLVLGGVWVAASALYENMRLNKASTHLITIVQNIRKSMATSPSFGGAAGANITNRMRDRGVFPVDALTEDGQTAVNALDPTTINNNRIQILIGPDAARPDQVWIVYRFLNDAESQRLCAKFLATNLRNGPAQVWDGAALPPAWVNAAVAAPETVTCGAPTLPIASVSGAHFVFDLR